MRDRTAVLPQIELLAASENVTRTLIHGVLDAIADTAVERSMKWTLTDDAMKHLQSIRANLNSGTDITAALVDFWLAVNPQPDTRLLMVRVSDADHAALEEQGKALGVTAEGFATLLAQQSAKNRREAVAQAKKRTNRKMLIVANSQQQGEQFIMRNAERLTGWSVTVHREAGSNLNDLRGLTFELVVVIGDVTDDDDALPAHPRGRPDRGARPQRTGGQVLAQGSARQVIRYHEDARLLLKRLDLIRPHYRNPISQDVDAINALIDRVGVGWPILVSRRTGQILGNAGLYEALLSRGEVHGPILFTDDTTDEEELVILVSQYALTSEAWIDPGLEIPILKELMTSEWALEGTGYDVGIFERRAQEFEDAMAEGFSEGAPTITCPKCHATIEIDRMR